LSRSGATGDDHGAPTALVRINLEPRSWAFHRIVLYWPNANLFGGVSDASAYDVMVSDEIGARHTILGFKTEAAAQEWIAKDRRTTARAEPDRDC
jgi:hypothetical protein